MQIILLVILYEDKKNDSKLKALEKDLRYSLSAKNTFNRTKKELYEGEEDLNRYFKTKDMFFLKHYYTLKDSIRYNLKNFGNHVKSNQIFSDKNKALNRNDLAIYNQKSNQSQFLSFNNENKGFGIKNLELISQHIKLLTENDRLLKEYNKAIGLLEEKVKLDLKNSYHNDKTLRRFLLTLVLIVTILLIVFTKMTFQYEERLKKAQEKIQNNLKFKDRIVGMISHEIRSPLNIISLYCKALEKKVKDQDLKDSIKSIQFAANSMYLMSHQVLNILKNENKKMQLYPTAFNLKEKLGLILKGLKDMVESAGNQFKLHLDIYSDANVDSDLIKIQELFCNIVGNANKFTNRGEIEVFVNCLDVSPEEYRLEVRIKDNGIGMSKKDLENVFTAYYQGEVSEELHNLGMGLGLNLCRELVEMFNGEIQVESQINEGTEVSFRIFLNKYKTVIETYDLKHRSVNQGLIMT